MIVNANLLLRPNADWSKIPQYDQADLNENLKFRPETIEQEAWNANLYLAIHITYAIVILYYIADSL